MNSTQPSWLWITDPWNTLDHNNDTTLRLIKEALKDGIKQCWCDVKTIRLETDQVRLDFHEVLEGTVLGPVQSGAPREFQQIHYRTDPPVDLAYLHPLELLALDTRSAPESSTPTEFVNPLPILFMSNEKTEAATLKGLYPPCWVGSQKDALIRFGKSQGRVVLKPLHQAQSLGVELLDWRNPQSSQEAETLLKAASHSYTVPVLLQKYLEGIQQGEIRLWFLDGDLIGFVKKLPIKGDFRVNIDQGSVLIPCELNENEKSQVGKLATHLKKWKIRLAAVDLIDGYVTDFNFTSPGLITQMEKVLNDNLSRKIVDRLKTRWV